MTTIKSLLTVGKNISTMRETVNERSRFQAERQHFRLHYAGETLHRKWCRMQHSVDTCTWKYQQYGRDKGTTKCFPQSKKALWVIINFHFPQCFLAPFLSFHVAMHKLDWIVWSPRQKAEQRIKFHSDLHANPFPRIVCRNFKVFKKISWTFSIENSFSGFNFTFLSSLFHVDVWVFTKSHFNSFFDRKVLRKASSVNSRANPLVKFSSLSLLILELWDYDDAPWYPIHPLCYMSQWFFEGFVN